MPSPSPVNPFTPASYNNAGSDDESHRRTSPSKEAPDTAAPSKKRATPPVIYETGKRARHRDLRHRNDGPAHSSSAEPSVVDARSAKEKESAEESGSAQGVMAFKQSIRSLGVDPENPMPDLESKCDWKGDAGLTHDVFRLGDTAVLTWKHGPNAGKVYDLVAVPNIAAPSKEEMLEKIDKSLNEIKAGSLRAQEFQSSLYLDYFGTSEAPGLRNTRFANKGLNELITEMEQTGVTKWLHNRNQELGLHEISKYGYGPINPFYSSILQNSKEIRTLFQPPGEQADLSNMAASHITYSEALDGIINAGALLPSDMLKAKGLVQLSGESGRGSGGYTGKKVSFSVFNDKPLLSPGFGSASGFSYPINWLVSNENLKKLELSTGTLGGESTVKGEVSLSLMNAVSVPLFAMADMQRVLSQHGYGHIKVIPLTDQRS